MCAHESTFCYRTFSGVADAVRSSMVGPAAIPDAVNAQDLSVQLEPDPPVAGTETKLGLVDTLEALHVASASFGEALAGVFDAAASFSSSFPATRRARVSQGARNRIDDRFDQTDQAHPNHSST
jgi:hypothetical protein